MNKVYCKECKYSGDPAVDLCKFPVDNWYAPDAPCNVAMSSKNRGNNCEDFTPKTTKKTKKK